MINKKSFTSLLALASFTINSCSYIPFSDRTQVVLNQVNEQIFEEDRFHLDEQDDLNDSKVTQYLNTSLQKVLKLYNIKNVSITAVNTYEAQATISYDDRIIHLSKGMLYSIKNEAELIALIGHEVGHLQLNHSQSVNDSKTPQIIKDVIESTSGIEVPEDFEETGKDIYLSQFDKRKEQDADQFGALTAQKLGYNPYLFVDLFENLSQASDQNIADKLKNIFKGSHKTLSERAKNLKNFLEENNIPNSGKVSVENYLKNVSHLGTRLKTNQILNAQKDLAELYQKLGSISKEKRPLTVEEFISYMQKIRSLAKNFNLLSELTYQNKNSKSNDNFMMESVKVLTPWWAPEKSNLEQLNQTLNLLSSMAIGSIPVIGDAVDMYELLTGKNFLTGEKLTFGERISSGIGVIAGSGKAWRTVSKELDSLKSNIIDEKELSKITKAATEALEESPILGKANKTVHGTRIYDKTIQEIERQYRTIKDEKNYKGLVWLADQVEPKNINDNFRVKFTKPQKKSLQGLEYTHPDNNHVKIRIMHGNPNSAYPNSRRTYVRQTIYGQSIDIHGNKVSKNSNEAHIPLEKWQFNNFWSAHLRK